MGEGSGRGSGRVGLFLGNRGSGQRFAGSGRVQEKWPVDNSGALFIMHQVFVVTFVTYV